MDDAREATSAIRAKGGVEDTPAIGRAFARRCARALPLAFASFAAFAVLSATPGTARAESPFAGKWKQAGLREDYTIQTWFNGCGPAPVSGTTGGGETVIVHEEGDQLVFVGGGRTFRTNQCYDPLPTLTREAHTRDPSGRMWRTRCATPQGDPRRALMQTLVAATSDTRLELTETGRYDIVLAEGRCVADVKRSRVFEAISTAAPAAPAPAVTPKPVDVKPEVPSGACESPGEPARLEARPSRKLLRTGEAFVFRAIVRDAAGCITSTPTSWSVAPTQDGVRRASVDPSGRVSIPADAAEGIVELIATAAGKSARVTIEVTSPGHYDELLAQSGLNSAGENDSAAIAVLETESIGGRDAQAEDGARRRRTIFIVVVGALVAILGALAVAGARRSRKAARIEAQREEEHAEQVREAEARRRARVDEHASQVRAHEESVQRAQLAAESARRRQLESAAAAQAAPAAASMTAMACPTCRREFPATVQFCPHDGGKLAPRDRPRVQAVGALCPTCKRSFSEGTRSCPFDKDELIPSAMPSSSPTVATTVTALAARGKICPTCGGRFDGNATFCGKDGTALVLLN